MKLVIHDLEKSNESILLNNIKDGITVISDNGKIHPCICCFGCWVKTPGQCVIKDGYDNMGELFSKSDQLIVISQCFYGGYSPFVKNVIDRSVCPYLLPYFKTKNGETHHPKRYKNKLELTVHFYGKISEAEKETAKKLVKANEINLFQKSKVCFYESFDEIKRVYHEN
jgi:multimeric flavodoxin WrbA